MASLTLMSGHSDKVSGIQKPDNKHLALSAAYIYNVYSSSGTDSINILLIWVKMFSIEKKIQIF